MKGIRSVVVLSAALAGCVLFTDFGEDLSSGGEPTPDGAAPATDAATDVVTTSDASVGADTGGMDVVPGDRPCAVDAGQIFCADFDVGEITDGWSGLSNASVGSVALDDTTSKSAPRSLLAKAPGSALYIRPAHLTKQLNAGFSTLSCSFAFRRDEISNAPAMFAALEVSYPDGDQYFAYVSTSTLEGNLGLSRYVSGESTAIDTAAPLTFPVGTWHDIRLEATPTNVRLHVDDALGASLVHEFTKAPLSAELSIGIIEVLPNSTSPWAVRYDDVRCFRTP